MLNEGAQQGSFASYQPLAETERSNPDTGAIAGREELKVPFGARRPISGGVSDDERMRRARFKVFGDPLPVVSRGQPLDRDALQERASRSLDRGVICIALPIRQLRKLASNLS